MAENPNAPMLSSPNTPHLPLSDTPRIALQTVFTTVLGAVIGAGLGAGVEAIMHGMPAAALTPTGAIDVQQTLAGNFQHFGQTMPVQIGAATGGLLGAGLSLHGEWTARLAAEQGSQEQGRG